MTYYAGPKSKEQSERHTREIVALLRRAADLIEGGRPLTSAIEAGTFQPVKGGKPYRAARVTVLVPEAD